MKTLTDRIGTQPSAKNRPVLLPGAPDVGDFIDPPEYHDDDLVCHCLSIKRGEITPLFAPALKAGGTIKLDKLISCSGAGSVCTGCHLLLREIVGERVWIPVKISSIRKVSDNTKTYCFESMGEAFHPARAGQHIIVQAYIDGRWELRRYTLTTPAAETRYREITVKRQPYGKFSSWLHRITASEKHLRISQPVGDVTPELVSSKPLICLVGGIGVTPVISFIRSVRGKAGGARRIILDYSEPNEGRLVCKNELRAIAEKNQNVSVHFRLTDTSRFISQHDINALLKKHPDSEFYVCGPPGFSKRVLAFLSKAGVEPEFISIESFSAPETEKIKPLRSYFYLGLVLVAAFLLQDLLQLKMPWLENLQTQEYYKIYSGLLLVIYVLSQFVMPYNKSCKKPHVSANSYSQHKFRGALAPLVFFMHSTKFGVEYLFVLSGVYFANLLLGLFNHEGIKNTIKRVRYFKFWLPAHIVLSVLMVSLITFHVYVIASY